MLCGPPGADNLRGSVGYQFNLEAAMGSVPTDLHERGVLLTGGEPGYGGSVRGGCH